MSSSFSGEGDGGGCSGFLRSGTGAAASAASVFGPWDSMRTVPDGEINIDEEPRNQCASRERARGSPVLDFSECSMFSMSDLRRIPDNCSRSISSQKK